MSGDGSKEGPDYFGFFKHELEDLFSTEKDGGADDYFPFMSFKSDGVTKEMSEKDVDETFETGGGEKSGVLFCDGLGGELSDYRKEKLKGLLKQSVSALKHEVDQMVEVVLATCQLQHKLKNKVTPSSSQGLASRDNDEVYPSMKRKKSNSPEVTDDLKFLLDNDRQQVEQTLKKYVDEIFSSLCHMDQQLEGFLDNITSKCRNMTFFEKQRLCNMIKNLPKKNIDRVVEIIRHGKGSDQHEAKDMFVDLEDTDNTVLWRLYYYSEAVENAQKMFE